MTDLLSEHADGIHTFRLERWADFHDLIERIANSNGQETFPSYIWRGQRDAHWSLSTTFDRLLQQMALLPNANELLERMAEGHLQNFKLATRGRRGSNPESLEPQEWWALGQHFGLATPLLDWTRSPYAGAYFAFEEVNALSNSPHRAIYGLETSAVNRKNGEISNGQSLETGRPPLLQVLDSLSNENARLVSQGGLFTRSPIGMPVEQWVSMSFEGTQETTLLKILLPDNEREVCLKTLDRMNINHASLFPDLTGASRATNLKAELYPELLRIYA